jgi:amino acid transporter
MLIVALAWTYVVLLMSLTEPTVVAGVMTFLLYCVVPLGILFYVTGGKRRKRRREAASAAKATEADK